MIYYSETGELLPAEEIDLEKGYLVDRETVYHEAEAHTASTTLPGGGYTAARRHRTRQRWRADHRQLQL